MYKNAKYFVVEFKKHDLIFARWCLKFLIVQIWKFYFLKNCINE